jgi:membrane protease subunit HflK
LKAPGVTKRRIYLETLQQVLPSLRSKLILDEKGQQILPLLRLDSEKVDKP